MAVILGMMLFAGAAMAAPSAGDKYPGISLNAQGSPWPLTAADSKGLRPESTRLENPLGCAHHGIRYGHRKHLRESDETPAEHPLVRRRGRRDGQRLQLVQDPTPTSASGATASTGLPKRLRLVGVFAEEQLTTAPPPMSTKWYNNITMPGNMDATGPRGSTLLARAPLARTSTSLLAAGKYIKGTVKDDSSSPLADVSVDAYDLNGNYMTSGYSERHRSLRDPGLPRGGNTTSATMQRCEGNLCGRWYTTIRSYGHGTARGTVTTPLASAREDFQLGIGIAFPAQWPTPRMSDWPT